jgi:hypothetical protein
MVSEAVDVARIVTVGFVLGHRMFAGAVYVMLAPLAV